MMHERLREFFGENVAFKTVALLFAFALWFFVNSKGTLEKTLIVPLELVQLPSDLALVGEVLDYVDVRVRGREAVIRGLTPDDVTVTLNLASAVAGENVYFLDQSLSAVPPRAEVVRVNPRRVVIRLEPAVRKSLRVVPLVVGKPARGHAAGRVQVSPASVTVEGAQSVMRTLEQLVTEPVDISGASTDVTHETRLSLMGRDVRLLEREPIIVRVGIVKVGARQDAD
jgi:YbbR domain-containing protein